MSKKSKKTETVPGRVIAFGFGPQNEEGNDYLPVEWQVLEEKSGSLLISKQILLCAPYHKKDEEVEWKDSDLRKFLNGEFLRRYTLSTSRLLPTGLGTEPGDKVTILSLDEMEKYFPTGEERACEVTPFAAKAMANNDCAWLRMDKASNWHCYSVDAEGNFETDYGFMGDACGIRPVIRLKD